MQDTHAEAGPAEQHAHTRDAATAEDIAEELLMEEVSIDGMCGVY